MKHHLLLLALAAIFAAINVARFGGDRPPQSEGVSEAPVVVAERSGTAAQQLFETVREGDPDDVRQALESRQWSASDLAEALVAAAGLDQPEEARLLLEAGANPNFNILMGSTPVIVAVREGSNATLKVLLMHGGDPDKRNIFDWAPLHHAILPAKANHKAIELLLAAGANVDARTNIQITPLHRAAGFCHARAVQMLIEAGADHLLTDNGGRTAYQRSVAAGCPGVGGLAPA